MVLLRGMARFWREWIRHAAQSGGIAAAGDVTAQYFVNKGTSTSNMSAESSTSCAGPVIDQRRVASIATFGFLYGGLFQRVVYQRFDAWLGVQRAFTVISKKVAMDVFLHAPFVYLPCFFVGTGLMQGKPLEDTIGYLRAKFADTMLAYVMIWPGAMFAMFWAVPEPSRIIFLAMCSFFEKAFYSWIQLGGSGKGAIPGVKDAGQFFVLEDSPLPEMYIGSATMTGLVGGSTVP
mmetsp:Transcript_40903/g.113718  ORF Transcript_40903/g.113718 Transcript_40903/m.113718 type:complete len:234 (-) Transcript_40903:135-836(-)